jgi:hypothetical protein
MQGKLLPRQAIHTSLTPTEHSKVLKRENSALHGKQISLLIGDWDIPLPSRRAAALAFVSLCFGGVVGLSALAIFGLL